MIENKLQERVNREGIMIAAGPKIVLIGGWIDLIFEKGCIQDNYIEPQST